MGDRFFPTDYYSVCSENTRQRRTRWFCNTPISPPSPSLLPSASALSQPGSSTIQNNTITSSSDESAILIQLAENEIDSDKDAQDIDPDFIPDDRDSDSNEAEEDLGHDQNEVADLEESSERYTTRIYPTTWTLQKNKNYSVATNLGEFKENGEQRKGNKKRDFCFFCESSVLNFARHILRNHAMENEIQIISALSPKNRNRKKMLADLRRKGNFLNSTNIKKPVRRGVVNMKILPCTNCKGYFSAKQLWRHRNKCMDNKDKFHQAKAQNLLLEDLRVDKQLRDLVFPRMRADEISMVAKTDILICAFGVRYLKSHREKHFVNVTSRKMRELARLLIEMKKLKSTIKNLFEALRPENFGFFVSATKSISGYNEENDFFESASTALNMGTSIKQCCQIAIIFVLKRKQVHSSITAAEVEADLKTLIQLIDSEWRFEISTQASNDLHMKKWNKITMVPLASDLKMMKGYLTSKANSAVNRLQTDSDDNYAYTALLETVFCRVLLLNRRRPGELQRLELHIYKRCMENCHQYEEFSEIITPVEEILLGRFKRVVIRGKRGRGVPVLFSPDVQEHIALLLKYRDKFINKSNIYLFGNFGSTQPICGYKVIKKYAKLSGAKNPDAITATKLRKHLATLTQVLNMSENDIEQLSTFMGHTVNVHRSSYRLPDDVFQTAKISKLLLLMESGEAGHYKGKSLDEIDVDMSINVHDNDNYKDEPENVHENSGITDMLLPGTSRDGPSQSHIQQTLSADPSLAEIEKTKKKKSKRLLVPWTSEQKITACQFFARHIEKCIPPKKHQCITLKEEHAKLFENKDWLKIKVFIQNEYKKRKSN